MVRAESVAGGSNKDRNFARRRVSISPARMRISVVLPAPSGPTSPVIAPLRKAMPAPLSACTAGGPANVLSMPRAKATGSVTSRATLQLLSSSLRKRWTHLRVLAQGGKPGRWVPAFAGMTKGGGSGEHGSALRRTGAGDVDAHRLRPAASASSGIADDDPQAIDQIGAQAPRSRTDLGVNSAFGEILADGAMIDACALPSVRSASPPFPAISG